MTTRQPPARQQAVAAVILLAVVVAIAAVGSIASVSNVDGWYAGVEKVAWNPPNWLFGPAWSVLYLMIAAAGFLIWRARAAGRSRPWDAVAVAFTAQLVLNALWTPIFFAGFPVMGEAAWWLALVVILALVATVLVLIVLAWKRDRAAAVLLLPYVLWLAFASTLNAGIIALN